MTLRQQNYVIPGYVRDGYCAPWSPLYVRSGYVRDGYVRPTPRTVNHALMSFDLARMPLYPEYSIEFNQWRRESGGGAISVGAPYAVRLYHSLSWPAICKADRDNLETFFRTIARAQSERWVWWNPIHGNALPMRFADADFPETPEVSLGYHKLSGLRLMVDVNYPGQIPTGSPNYNAAMGTALSIGSVVMLMPAPTRPNTGYGVATRHAREDSSAGEPVVYRVGKTSRRVWTLSWDNLHYIHWIRLQAFFCAFVRGMRTNWTWYDTDGTARTVRLAEPRITVKQVGYDRFTCTLPLIEDI